MKNQNFQIVQIVFLFYIIYSRLNEISIYSKIIIDKLLNVENDVNL
jgi:hypothetical protein